MDTTTMLAQGTMLRNGTYRVERHLAAGGFGNTYLVRNVAFNELYAMKEFFMRGVNMRKGNAVTVSVPDNHASYDSQKEKFRKEAVRLRNLRNPHIVKVHDLFEENGTVYYIMDYIDGQSVAEQIKHSGMPLTEQQAWRILPQVLDALKEVHAQEIWHLDIKPGNIMLNKSGEAYLIDFGASKQFSTGGSQTSSALCYTPGYAPVEQVEQAMDKFGPWTDFYALGATLYYMQTLQQPPSSTALAEGDGDAFHFPAEMSSTMRDLICWMMAPARKKRPQSVAEVEQRIAQAAGSGGGAATVVSQKVGVVSPVAAPLSDATSLAVQQEGEKKGGGAWKIVVPLLVLLAGLGVGAYFMFFSKSPALKAAEAAQEEYEEKVAECRKALKTADSFPDLDKAKEMFADIEEMEDEHGRAMPDVYDQLDDLKELHGKMEEKQKEEYLELAKNMIDSNDYRLAYDLYNEAAQSLPDDAEVTSLRDQTAKDMGYIYVTQVKFGNEDAENILDDFGATLHSERMRYLNMQVVYNSLLPEGHENVKDEFTFKVFLPDGDLKHSVHSPSGYTSDGYFYVAHGEVGQGEKLGTWGNADTSTYPEGEYSFELYYKHHKIYTCSFTIVE